MGLTGLSWALCQLFLTLLFATVAAPGLATSDRTPDWLSDELALHQQVLSEALEAHRGAERPLHEFSLDWGAHLREARSRIETAKEKDRGAAYFAYLDLGFGAYGADLDPGIVDAALETIAPDSSLWSLEPDLIEVAALQAGDRSLVAAYMPQVIAEHDDPRVRRVAATRANPARRMAPGKPVPSFSFESLTEPGTTYTDATLKGSVYVIDFWATWCAPCIAEMSGLHAAYADYESQNFEILSVSLDDTETVERFRRERWPMPWLHAVVPRGLESPALEPFELSGLPMPILVDETGGIVAIGPPLRGPRLHRTLARVIEE